MSWSGVSPPATKRTLALCCAVPDSAPAAIAVDASCARRNSNDCIAALLGFAAGLLDGRDDVGIGPATAEVGAHAFADIGIVRAARLLEQRERGPDLGARAVGTLVRV